MSWRLSYEATESARLDPGGSGRIQAVTGHLVPARLSRFGWGRQDVAAAPTLALADQPSLLNKLVENP